jgi:hypothetical protein
LKEIRFGSAFPPFCAEIRVAPPNANSKTANAATDNLTCKLFILFISNFNNDLNDPEKL